MNPKPSYTYEEITDCYRGDYAQYMPHIDISSDPEFTSFINSMFPKIRLIDRITAISETGGIHGLGEIVGETDIDASHWAFDCHFKNDPVFSGSLMLEGINHLALFFFIHSGIVFRAKNMKVYPLKNRWGKSSFRGQVRPIPSTLTYNLSVSEVYETEDYAHYVFDGNVYWQGMNVARLTGMTVCLE
jgi:3-hydroxyacyl-[acyl-carrier protein] dehydratase/trans-2-decenoyl-[acyl-carrier protein] isomerase